MRRTAVVIAAVLVLATLAGTAQAASPRAHVVATLRANHLPMWFDGRFQYGFFGPRARAYRNPGGEILLWQFRTGKRARVNAHRVSRDGSTIGRTHVLWMGQPRWYRQGRVIALYFGPHAGTSAALRRVLGPPFAGG